MIAVNAVFVSLATVSVALRLYVRRKQRVSNLAADDWLILVALVRPRNLHPILRMLDKVNNSEYSSSQ